MEKKKSTVVNKRKVGAKKTPLRRKKKKNLSNFIPTIIIASFIVVFLLWRIVVLIPKLKENKEIQKETKTTVEKVEEKSKRKIKEKNQILEKENEKVEKKPIHIAEKSEKKELEKVKENGELENKKEKETIPAPRKELSGNLEGEPECSIVIDDVGSSLELLEYAVKILPKTTTFAIIPFQKYSRESAELLHKEGFHIILHSPMEAEETGLYYNTQYVLKSSMTKKEVEKALETQLEGVPYAEGMNNHTGSKATKDPELMRSVMKFAKSKGLYFLDSRTTPFTVAYKIAVEEGVRAAERKVFLDDDNRESAIILKIDELALLAQKEKKAVAIGHLRNSTIKTLASRIAYWQNRGVKFIALSDIIKGYGTGS
ncbi:MAG: divergent polysaccharide deacetylase family protein [Thermoanaerobaculaceae bacterium]|nr:divergent polysaccharide deacetylase family protein [Thermoanaerobaculaceae bacterium]